MEIKEMVVKARKAQEIYEHHFDQDQVDRVIREAARVIYDHAEELARLAVDETGMGVYEHKVAKNRNKSKGVYYNLRGKKSMGIIDMDEKTGLIEIAKPIGVVAGITPMTNPIVTPMSKIIFALKTKNAIIIAPHPQSKRCSALAVNLIKDVVAPFGVPADLIQVIDEPSIDKTKELMESLVATGQYQLSNFDADILDLFAAAYADEAETATEIKRVYEASDYIEDPHTAVASAVYQKYRTQTGDTAKTVIASTASPYKFPVVAVEAVTGETGLGDFEALAKLHTLSGVPVPPAVDGLETAPVRHRTSVAAKEMQAALEDYLGL